MCQLLAYFDNPVPASSSWLPLIILATAASTKCAAFQQCRDRVGLERESGEYFYTLLESNPWDECSKLKRQGWYRDVAGQMDKWGGDCTKPELYNKGDIKSQKALVNDMGEYEFNVCPMPCNFTQHQIQQPQVCLHGQEVPCRWGGYGSHTSDGRQGLHTEVLPCACQRHSAVHGRTSGKDQRGESHDLPLPSDAL